jgi:CheY-like chemotaxis protein
MMPQQDPAHDRPNGPESVSSKERHRAVLVVEDDAAVRMAMRLLLEPEGYQVLEAANGQEAITLAVDAHPDLILMDLALPGLNGLDAATHLGMLPETARIPVIAVTASWLGSQTAIMREVGFQATLSKPFKSGQLLAEIRRALAHPTP